MLMANNYSGLTKMYLQFARLRQKSLIVENRSAAYIEVCEQRIAENQRLSASIVEL